MDSSTGFREDSFHIIQQAIQKMETTYTLDGLITKLSFGFWTYQLAKKQYAAAGSSLIEVFPNRSFGTKQKDIFQNLVRVNDIRNRIAHYEPICFDKDTGAVSTVLVLHRCRELILELLSWLGCNVRRILYGIDGVPKAIGIVNTI